MRRLPQRIRILGTDWTITIVPNLHDDAATWGDTSHRLREIRLDPDADQPTVVVHELLHAIEYAQGLDLNDEQIQLLARGLVASLRDNPPLRAWLAERLA